MLGFQAALLYPSPPAGLGSMLSRLQLGIRASGPTAVRGQRAAVDGICCRAPSALFASFSARTAVPSTARDDGVEAGEDGDLLERDGGKRWMKMVPSISPSSVASFKQCPQQFYHK